MNDLKRREWLRDYLVNGIILAFNFNDVIELQGIIAGVRGTGRPLIAMVSPRAIKFLGLNYIKAIFEVARNELDEPIFLQLDHANDLQLISDAIAVGFDIIMADFSSKDFDSNCRAVSIALQLAEDSGALVEAELGLITASKCSNEEVVSISEVLRFVSRAKSDLLALPFGNCHGFQRHKPRLKIEYIDEVVRALEIPLVMHGCDFVEAAELREAVRVGVKKLNFGPELRVAFVDGIRLGLEKMDLEEPDQRILLERSRASVHAAVARRVRDLLPQ